jgi:hypothetical protein
MSLSFSIPASFCRISQVTAPDVEVDGDIKLETTHEQEQLEEQKAWVATPAVCADDRCMAKRNYGLVQDWERGTCGMYHLHVLERKSGSGPVAV